MHDTLDYFAKDPVHRKWHHNSLTFGLLYVFSEHFFLPLSHDEVVHGKGSLLGRMAGRRVAEVRQPARALRLDVGAPGQEAALHGRRVRPAQRSGTTTAAWTGTCSSTGMHAGRPGAGARSEPHPTARSRRSTSWTATARGFQWLQADAADANVFAFVRWSRRPFAPRGAAWPICRRCRATTIGWVCPSGKIPRADQHGRTRLRRIGRGKPGAHRDGRGGLGRAAAIGTPYLASARHRLAGPGGVGRCASSSARRCGRWASSGCCSRSTTSRFPEIPRKTSAAERRSRRADTLS